MTILRTATQTFLCYIKRIEFKIRVADRPTDPEEVGREREDLFSLSLDYNTILMQDSLKFKNPTFRKKRLSLSWIL